MKNYPLILWLKTICIAVILFSLSSMILTKNFEDDFLSFMIFILIYFTVYSLPAFIILLLIYRKIRDNFSSKNKFIFSVLAIILMLISCFVVFGKEGYNPNKNYGGLSFSLLFTSSIIIATLTTKSKPNTEIKHRI
jgi:peptidoglycan/LPS O-acetylase OafA/YrhL